MSNLKCLSCGLVNFATAANCKRCNESLTAAAVNNHSQISTFSVESDSKSGAEKPVPDVKELFKITPFIVFIVPLFLVVKDRMTQTNVKVGGHVDTLQLSILTIATIGLLVYSIIFFTVLKKK
jgi:uncharacterized OB-fold protein